MLQTIYIARHGFRLNWVNSNWHSPTGMPRDSPLAAYGESQAKELANHILSFPLETRPTAIFSSPFYRCLQTAKPVAEALKLPLYIEHGIGEWYPPVIPGTGLHPQPGPAETLLPWFPEIDPSWSSTYLPNRGGEPLEGLYGRIDDFLKAFVPRVEQQSGHTHILFVSHAATVIALIRELLGQDEIANTLRVGCCTLSTLKRKADCEGVLGGWDDGGLGEGSFLKNGVERDWGMLDIEEVQESGDPSTVGEVLDTAAGLQTWESSAKL